MSDKPRRWILTPTPGRTLVSYREGGNEFTGGGPTLVSTTQVLEAAPVLDLLERVTDYNQSPTEKVRAYRDAVVLLRVCGRVAGLDTEQ